MKQWIKQGLIYSALISTLIYGDFEGKRIQSIQVRLRDSKEAIDTQSLVHRLSTREGVVFSQEAFDRDLKMLSSQYEDVQPRLIEANNQIQIVLTLSCRPLIKKIAWKGNKELSSTTLKKDLAIEEGSLLDREKLNDGISKIRLNYLKKGFYQVKVRYALENQEEGYCKLVVQIDEGVNGKIRDIKYNGFQSKELSSIHDFLILQPYSFWTSWYTGRGYYVEDALELDRSKLIQKLQDGGYADALVRSKIEESPNKKGIDIIFDADRGDPYYIESIDLTGVKTFDISKIQAFIDAKKGDLYSPSKLRAISDKISEYYGSRGFCDIIVGYDAHIDHHEKKHYDVEFQVEEGRQYKVGMVRFSGNYQTKPRVLMHESLMVPGELISTKKIKATENRLMNTGYFKSVHIRTLDSSPEGFPEGLYKDIIIEVEEEESTAKFGLQFGAGVSQGVYGGLNATLNNFYAKGVPNLLTDGIRAVKGNGEHLSIETMVSAKSSTYNLSWTDPYFLDTPWSFGFDIDSTVQRDYDTQDFYTRSKGITFFGYYPLNDYLRVRVSDSIRSEEARLQANLQRSAFASQSKHHGLFNTVGTALMYDSTDRRMIPTKGFRSTLGASITDGPAHYLKFFYHNSYYYSFFEDSTLKIRVDLDVVDPILGSNTYNVPLSQRMFNGGDDSLRGYRYASLGPKDPSTGDPYGGISKYLASVEYIYRINETFSIFVFEDNGGLSNTRYKAGAMYSSYGWGVRLNLMGRFPLTLGFGYPIKDKENENIRKNFFFSIGGKF